MVKILYLLWTKYESITGKIVPNLWQFTLGIEDGPTYDQFAEDSKEFMEFLDFVANGDWGDNDKFSFEDKMEMLRHLGSYKIKPIEVEVW